jgi:hypothetical protein
LKALDFIALQTGKHMYGSPFTFSPAPVFLQCES